MMSRRPLPIFAAALALLVLALAAGPARAAVPANFVDELIIGSLQTPTDITIDPAGRIWVVEKQGTVWIVQNGVKLPNPVIDLRDEVHNGHDKGMLCVALDPDFANNRYAYFLYQVDPVFGQPDEYPEEMTFGRLTRYTIGPDDQADLDSRFILIGNDWSDGVPHGHRSHAIGTVRFGPDGNLMITTGDGAHYDYTDGGQNVSAYDPDFAARFGVEEDIGSLRAQRLDSLCGKVLRIDPATGQGLLDNPFYNGDPNANRSKVWAYGLRNPYRFTIRPGTGPQGTLYISDVGWTVWEEVNVSANGGENFGWPCYEGTPSQPQYNALAQTAPTCNALGAGAVEEPVIEWHHSTAAPIGFIGNAATGLAFYPGTAFPAQYQGKLFFSDYGRNWIRMATVDANNQVTAIQSFGDFINGPVDIEYDPTTESLLYVSITNNSVRRIRYAAGSQPPVAVAAATPTAGSVPLHVNFSSTGTSDPNGDPLTLEWDFGDGSPISTAANPSHTYETGGTFAAILTVTDSTGLADSASVLIQTSNQPPTVNITSPADRAIFDPGQFIQLLGSASDPEDGSNLSYHWEVQLIHNNHLHPEIGAWDQPTPPAFAVEGHGEAGDRYSYVAKVTVTDSGGLTATDQIRLLPSDIGGNQPPTAVIDAAPLDGTAVLTLNVAGTNSFDPDGDLIDYFWDFGDGTFDTSPVTTHVYSEEGSYVVTLTVTDVTGATDTASVPVSVYLSAPMGFYYSDTSLTTLFTTRAEEPIDFNYSNSPPFAGMPSNDFGVRWVGQLQPQFSQTYTFYTQNDDGVRLWVNGQLLIDAWEQSPFTERSATIALQAEKKYDFVMEYADFNANAQVRLVWSSPSRSKQVVPTSRLFGPSPPNLPPIPDAGHDLRVVRNAPISIAGTMIDDGRPGAPGAVTSTWTRPSGPAAVLFSDPSSPQTNATFPASGDYVIRLTGNDGALSAFDQASIHVNAPPQAQSQIVNTGEGTPVGITLAATDADGDPVAFTIASLPGLGILSGTPPNMTFTPSPGANGSTGFGFYASDDLEAGPTATVTINVTGVNSPPVATPQTVAAQEDTAVGITLAATDDGPGALTFEVLTLPAKGTLSGTPPNLTFTPGANLNGPDSFTFRASDGLLPSDPATVTINIQPINDAPTAIAQNLATDEDSPLPITLAGSDIEGSALTFTILSQPAHGDLSGGLPNITYTPDPNYFGPDQFTFRVRDGALNSPSATISINVQAVNDPPVASGQAVNLNEDTPAAILLGAADPDPGALSFAIADPPAHGALSGVPPSVTYTPDENYNGPDSFTFTASDGILASGPATVTLSVAAVNDAPSADALAILTNEDVPADVKLTGADPENTPLTFSVAQAPAHGSLTGTPPNLSYRPSSNYHGPDSFTYRASDGALDSPLATVSIDVVSVNDLPVAFAKVVNIDEDQATSITLEATDADDDPLEFGIVAPPAKGTLEGTPPNLTYRPNANANGFDSFAFRAHDGTAPGNTRTVSINIAPVNDLPVAQPILVQALEDETPAFALAAIDPDGDAVEYEILEPPAAGAFSGDAPNLLFEPPANYFGAFEVQYRARDAEGFGPAAALRIEIASVNDEPFAADFAITTEENVPAQFALAASDNDGEPLLYEILDPPAHGQVELLGADATYSPALAFSGDDAIRYRVSDGAGASSEAVVWLTVKRDPTATLSSIAAWTFENQAGFAVTVRLSEPTSKTVSVTLTAIPVTAQPGEDFVPPSEPVVFLPGETEKTVIIQILDDGDQEGWESFLLAIAAATNGHLSEGSPPLEVGIYDNESLSSARNWRGYE